MTPVSRLAERMRRALRDGRGITFSAADMDTLTMVGALEVLTRAETAELLEQVKARRNAPTKEADD